MDTVAETNGVSKDVTDLYGNPFHATLAEVVEHLSHAPYWHVDEKAPARLVRAAQLIRQSRVQLHDSHRATVYGTTRSYDLDGYACTCPASQKGPTHWCVHAVTVKLARTLEERMQPSPMLPLPPTTVDERLAQAAAVARDHVYDALPVPLEDRAAFNDEDLEARDLEPPHTPKEDRMPADEYQPWPDDEDAPVAVVDLPETMPPAPVKIPREFTVRIKDKVHVKYTGLVVAARANGLMTLSADWTYNDAELSLAHAVCTFADGRRYEESGDASPSNVSKGIGLHFRRVALTRAKARCLRDALGISECSVEEMEDESGKHEVPVMQPPTHQQYRQRIWSRVKELAPQARTREAVEAWVKARTRLDLHPDNYQAIVEYLTDAV